MHLSKKMNTIGITFEIYRSLGIEDDESNGFDEHRAIWLGRDVSVEVAKAVIKHSKQFYPHLKYINLSEGEENSDIYVGGSTKSAVKYFKLRPLSDKDFERLEMLEDLESLHEYILKFKR